MADPRTQLIEDLVFEVGPELANQKLNLVNDLRTQAYMEIIKAAYRRKARQEVQDDKVSHTLLRIAVADIGKDFFVADSKAGRKSQQPMKFITINAKDGIDPKEFWEQMAKCVKKQKLQAKRGYYVLEQRSEGDQDPYGWHIHWLVDLEGTTSDSVVCQQVYQCFQRFVAGKNYVDYRPIYNEEQWNQKLEYMKGNKKTDKIPKVWKDRVLRPDLEIPEIISY